LGIVATIAATRQAPFHPAERADQHRASGANYSKILRRIEALKS
jgi:hypothetical protein